MTPGAAGLIGAAGGAGGALAGHAALLAARRLTGEPDIWLKGPHGPPFFELALATAVFFAVAGACAGGGAARPRARRGAAGFASAFLALALPMALCTRLFAWGEAGGPTFAWVYLVLACYGAANAAGAWAVGASLAPRDWRAGASTLGAAGLAWLADRPAQWALSKALGPLPAGGLLPPPQAVASGLVWGAALGIAVAWLQQAFPKSRCHGRCRGLGEA